MYIHFNKHNNTSLLYYCPTLSVRTLQKLKVLAMVDKPVWGYGRQIRMYARDTLLPNYTSQELKDINTDSIEVRFLHKKWTNKKMDPFHFRPHTVISFLHYS